MQTFHFTSFEKGIVLTLSSVFFCRMTGLFMPLPILALAAAPMQGFSPFLLGWALGIHGLTQALLQVPLGILSDRIGRRKLIVAGLLVFILGSSLAALSESIYSLIVARALQGAGAVSSVMMACAADYLRPAVHAKGMAFIGLGIGSAFVLSLPLGSILTAPWGLDGIFIIAAVLGAFAVLIVLIGLPAESKAAAQQRLPLLSATGLKKVFYHPGLLHLNVGIFVLHFILAANFLVLPHLITILSGLELARHWQLYTPILLLSFVLMLPYLAYAERRKKTRAFLLSAIAFLGLSQLVLFACLAQGFTNASLIWFFISSLLVFFFAFNYLEANLPALLSRYSPVGRKGAAMGSAVKRPVSGSLCRCRRYGLAPGARLRLKRCICQPWYWLLLGWRLLFLCRRRRSWLILRSERGLVRRLKRSSSAIGCCACPALLRCWLITVMALHT